MSFLNTSPRGKKALEAKADAFGGSMRDAQR